MTVCNQVLNKWHGYKLFTGFHEHNYIVHVYNMTKKANTSVRCGMSEDLKYNKGSV